jgi:hypothetical protein
MLVQQYISSFVIAIEYTFHFFQKKRAMQFGRGEDMSPLFLSLSLSLSLSSSKSRTIWSSSGVPCWSKKKTMRALMKMREKVYVVVAGKMTCIYTSNGMIKINNRYNTS